MVNYDHKKVEKRWQEAWEKEGIYTPDIKKAKNPFYNLWMFPYPSAEGLHAGHAFSSTGSDIYGRFMRMNGKDVFQPIGYDSFGIHSENYAIKIGENPNKVVKRTTKNYEKQMKSLGHGYDWTRTVTTSDVDYYKWTQWLFIEMYKQGLAYRKKAEVNFCPSCKTVLADEQVIDNKCERCTAIVEKKSLDQWFFKITDYADRLLEGLNKIDWSQRVVIAQKEWIGKSVGRLIKFKIEDGEDLEIFTTRPDTLNAVTFLATSKLYEQGSKEKIGKFSGKYAISPLDNRKIPIWNTNYVTPNYGTGIVMGVPAHDQRDMDFANKYGIDILKKDPVNNNIGKKHVSYHLRDWLVSRQRYWGAPIPMIFCEKCDWQIDENLPVLLPDIKDYKPEGNGRGPLANHPEFYKTKCPKCGGEARRETDVMDTFVDSSWYFLRYPNVGSKSKFELLRFPWNPDINKKWLPVDLYFGGAEHSVLHLMYARFINMVMYDRGYLDHEEPFPKFFAHGLMIKDGAKMSKSRGNVINPDVYVNKFGADTLRMYVMFMGPMDGYPDFRDSGIEGMGKFLKKVWRLFQNSNTSSSLLRVASQTSRSAAGISNSLILSKMHKTIKKVGEDIENYKFNTAISAIMEFVNMISDADVSSSLLMTNLCKLLAPFAPHMMEEVWQTVLGNQSSVHLSKWPEYDPKYLIEDEVTIAVQVNGKLRSTITVDSSQSTDKKFILKLAKQDEKVAKWLKNGRITKEIFIPNKLINLCI